MEQIDVSQVQPGDTIKFVSYDLVVSTVAVGETGWTVVDGRIEGFPITKRYHPGFRVMVVRRCS